MLPPPPKSPTATQPDGTAKINLVTSLKNKMFGGSQTQQNKDDANNHALAGDDLATRGKTTSFSRVEEAHTNEGEADPNKSRWAGWRTVSDLELVVQKKLGAAMERGEMRITHHSICQDSRNPLNTAYLMLTNKSLYFCSVTQPDVSKWEVRNFYRVSVGGAGLEHTLTLLYFQGFKLMDPMVFEFSNPLHANLWECLLQRRQLEIFQEECEAKFVLSPSVYQRNFPVFKVNRKHVEQERTLVLSNTHLYNLECRAWPLAVKESKWAVKLSEIKGVGCSHGSTDILIQINPHAHDKAKDRYQFRFLDVLACQEFIAELKRVCQWYFGVPLAQFELPSAI